MRKVPFTESLRIITQGSLNWIQERPIVVSFEVTDSCTCFCLHCDHGGPKDNAGNMKPADYRRYMDVLKPVVVQVSGGEPLMRKDLADVVRNIKAKNGLPFALLADLNHRVCSSYGVWGRKQFMGRTYEGVLRTTFLIDRTGRIAHVFEKVRPAEHSVEVLAALKSL